MLTTLVCSAVVPAAVFGAGKARALRNSGKTFE